MLLFFVSFVDLHTCRFIHSLQTIMQEVFILYLCDDLPLLFLWLFFFYSRLCLKIHFCYDSWPVSSGIHIYNLSPIYWHLFILTVLVSVWHVMYAYCIARYVECVYKNNSITMLLRFVPNVFQYLNKRPWSDPLERRRKDGNQENLATLYLRELTWIAAF